MPCGLPRSAPTPPTRQPHAPRLRARLGEVAGRRSSAPARASRNRPPRQGARALPTQRPGARARTPSSAMRPRTREQRDGWRGGAAGRKPCRRECSASNCGNHGTIAHLASAQLRDHARRTAGLAGDVARPDSDWGWGCVRDRWWALDRVSAEPAAIDSRNNVATVVVLTCPCLVMSLPAAAAAAASVSQDSFDELVRELMEDLGMGLEEAMAMAKTTILSQSHAWDKTLAPRAPGASSTSLHPSQGRTSRQDATQSGPADFGAAPVDSSAPAPASSVASSAALAEASVSASTDAGACIDASGACCRSPSSAHDHAHDHAHGQGRVQPQQQPAFDPLRHLDMSGLGLRARVDATVRSLHGAQTISVLLLAAEKLRDDTSGENRRWLGQEATRAVVHALGAALVAEPSSAALTSADEEASRERLLRVLFELARAVFEESGAMRLVFFV
jgi:hypothetical protein